MTETKAMCPFCGVLFDRAACRAAEIVGNIPRHTTVVTSPSALSAAALQSGAVEEEIPCPGSGQRPRNPETDRRPLWEDE